LRLEQWGYFHGPQWIVFITATALSLSLLIWSGFYRVILRYIDVVAFKFVIQIFLIYAGVICLIFTFYGVDKIPRSIGVIQPILFFIGIGISRYLVGKSLGGENLQKINHTDKSNVIIYGAGLAGRQLATILSNSKKLMVVGFIDDDIILQGGTINGVNVYSNCNLKALFRRLNISDVLFSIPSIDQDRRRKIIASLSGCGVRVRALANLIDLDSGRINISNLHDLDINDLLNREVVLPDTKLLEKNIRDKVVLVTGAGGSIGSELCRQIIKFSPKSLILLDTNEYSLFLIYEELKKSFTEIENNLMTSVDEYQTFTYSHSRLSVKLVPYLTSVCDGNRLLKIFNENNPETVFHAAAYKHVPLVEFNFIEGIKNNVFGTLTCAQISLECCVKNFILISTDKAVRPTNVMGASKRIAEQVLQALADFAVKNNHATKFSMVRFGNVLDSSGSVVELFRAQIATGGPITLTHPEVTRYFMTIPEAAQLVIQASAMAEGGDVFILNMGEPVHIYDLALKMIYLSGYLVKDDAHPNGDIEIKIIGLRPGEKLYEELLISNNPKPTTHPKIMKAHEDFILWSDLQSELKKLNSFLDMNDEKLVKNILKKLVPGYQQTTTK